MRFFISRTRGRIRMTRHMVLWYRARLRMTKYRIYISCARVRMTKNKIHIRCARVRIGKKRLKKGKQKAFGKNQRLNGKWQQPILPVGCPTSTFGAAELNFCVRNENRWDLSAIVTTMDI